MAGVKLPLALAELGLIDEYEFIVQPRLAGHGPTLFAGLSKHVDLKLVGRLEFSSGRWRCDMSREGSLLHGFEGPLGDWSFPRPTGGGIVIVTYPFSFTPQVPADPAPPVD